MTKQLLCLLIATFLTVLPVSCFKSKQHIAAYVSIDLLNPYINAPVDFDYLYPTKSFDEFDTFLKNAKKLSNDEPLILDLAIHGMPDVGLVGAGTSKDPHYSNLGMILNHIEKVFPHAKNITIVMESCYAPYVYARGIRGQIEVHSKRFYLENHEDVPDYPIYGSKYNTSNYALLSLLDYLHEKHQVVVDLRQFEESNRPKPDSQYEEEILNKLSNLLDKYEEE